MMVIYVGRVLGKDQINFNKNTLYRNFFKDDTNFTMTAKDINVAIKWEDINGNLITPDYGTISALNVKIVNYTEGLSALAPGSEVLEMVPCDEYNFSPDPDVLAKVKDHLCMSNTTSFELSGDVIPNDLSF